ncbi:MAG: hypothetical protein A2374_05005 [Candidatus Moranbacteria bacterium RIFOXYB1_FULL_44_23]|nr:MAG: hypothetical protein A2194_01570 [Candidatus Moranbacteria bacterium RIFOXYA1_FULL_44_8]OGI34648.1 MAG: hypothetical protein A2407_05205 [Candidatus Moranbacteria bacterium RIFOXYC1_FULL_44_8]OGI39112.1 MAG: hypothetical protein A2374_05005 [Candidatus Moranbacteria bacterium RIFOXYB1_FULL_44_23]
MRIEPFGKFFQPLLNNGEYFFVRFVGFVFLFAPFLGLRANIANWRLPRIYSLIQPRNHSVNTSLFSHGIVKFSTASQHRFNEFLGWIIANRFRNRIERSPIIKKHFSHVKMIFRISREAIHLVDYKSVNLAFVFPAKFNSSQKLGSIRRLG